MGETAILELSLGCRAAVMYSTLGFNFTMRESEYGIAMAEGMSCYANYILGFQNVLLKNERILVDEFDLLRFIWEDPDMEEIAAKGFKLLLHLIDGAKDWLLSMPELSAGGFRTFLDEKLGQSFLVFPDGRIRICDIDSVALDSDLNCFMGGSQTDGAYFSRSGGRDTPCVSYLSLIHI